MPRRRPSFGTSNTAFVSALKIIDENLPYGKYPPLPESVCEGDEDSDGSSVTVDDSLEKERDKTKPQEPDIEVMFPDFPSLLALHKYVGKHPSFRGEGLLVREGRDNLCYYVQDFKGVAVIRIVSS